MLWENTNFISTKTTFKISSIYPYQFTELFALPLDNLQINSCHPVNAVLFFLFFFWFVFVSIYGVSHWNYICIPSDFASHYQSGIFFFFLNDFWNKQVVYLNVFNEFLSSKAQKENSWVGYLSDELTRLVPFVTTLLHTCGIVHVVLHFIVVA